MRQLLDDFDQAAPWGLLYAPPPEAIELVERLQLLLDLIDQAPPRVAAELELLASGSSSEDEREALREAEFYFSALHQMTAQDQRRLGEAIEQTPSAGRLPRSRSDFLCELAADLKGKYASAMMGAAAALVSEGRYLGIEVEALLFVEKADEGERNRRLLAALESAASSLREAVTSFPWRTVLASWRRQQQVDHYALADLVSLRSHLLRLLSIENRRALYSGDYHQLQGRESGLGIRLRELEALHLRSLEYVPGIPESDSASSAAELFARLQQLLLEVAALLDVETLRALIGDQLVGDLRRNGSAPAGRESSAGRLEPLALLLLEEDLTLFLALLVSAVRKRSSIAYGLGDALATRLVAPAPETPPEPRPAPLRPLVAPLRLDRELRLRIAAKLRSTLDSLTGADNPRWQAFHMVQKLQARLRVLPPALLAETAPFLAELHSELLPLLEEASAAGALPRGAVETLRSCYQRLCDSDFTRPELALEVGGDLARVIRLLDSLRAAATALQS